jgi:hypothetical protein
MTDGSGVDVVDCQSRRARCGRHVAWLPLSFLVSAGWGCSDYKPGTDVRALTTSDWSCLKDTSEPPKTPGSPGNAVIYSLRLVDLATDAPYPDVPVTACGLTDLDCLSPVADNLHTDADGLVNVRLTENFSGYLEINSDAAVPYLFHLPDTGLRTQADYPLAMIAIRSFSVLLGAFSLPTDPSLASIGFRAFDCRGVPAGGVSFHSSAGGQAWYFEAGLPSTTRTQTDVSGLGGFIGSTTGVSTLDAQLPDGRVITTKSVIVREGWMTAGYLRPNVDPE